MIRLFLSLLFVVTAWCDAANLRFDETVKTINADPAVNKVSADFLFENPTDKVVKITSYKASCDCMKVEVKGGKLVYQPGEKGILRANFDMGNFSGEVDKAVKLWLDGDSADKPSVNLTVKVNIPVIVQVDPKTLRWDLNGKSDAQTIDVTMNFESPVKIKSAYAGNPNFHVIVKTVEEGERYQIVVTPKSVQKPTLAVIQLTTDCPIARHATQRVFAIVRKPIVTSSE